MDRLRVRIKDKRVVALVRAFLKAGIMTRIGEREERRPAPRREGRSLRCWPTSPCPRWTSTSPGNGGSRWARQNSGPSAERTAKATGGSCATPMTSSSWCRRPRTRRGPARGGGRRPRTPGAAPVAGEDPSRPRRRGLRLPRLPLPSATERGTSKYYVYTNPSKKAIQAIKDKVKVKTYRSTRNQDLDELITSLNQTLVGWALYFRHGVSKAIFNAIDHHTWDRLMRWIRAKYKGKNPGSECGDCAAASASKDGGSRTTGWSSPALQRPGDPLPLPRQQDPHPVGPDPAPPPTADQRARHVESPVR